LKTLGVVNTAIINMAALFSATSIQRRQTSPANLALVFEQSPR